MKYQLIAGAGLAAGMALCGYMIAQLDADRGAAGAVPSAFESPIR